MDMPTSQPTATLMDFVVPLIPWLLIFVFIWFFVFRVTRRQSAVNAGYMERARQHMDAVEAKLDRLITLNERGPDRRDPPAPPPLPPR